MKTRGILHSAGRAGYSLLADTLLFSLAGMTNTIPRLEAMGFPGEYFAGAMTSGETTFRSLQDRPDQWWQKLGHRCIHITWRARGAVSVGGMGIEVHEIDLLERPGELCEGKKLSGRGKGWGDCGNVRGRPGQWWQKLGIHMKEGAEGAWGAVSMKGMDAEVLESSSGTC